MDRVVGKRKLLRFLASIVGLGTERAIVAVGGRKVRGGDLLTEIT
jgi:hypothetical protein